MGTLSLKDFRATGQAMTMGPDWVTENIGLDAEPRDMSIIMYDEGCWIECVPDGTYFVICYNEDLVTEDLEKAEEFLYNHCYKED